MSYTKEDLKTAFGINSTNTVRQTLQACGLPTSRRSYTNEEIEGPFSTARQMIEAGRTYDEVADHFQAGARQAAPGPSAAGTAANGGQEAVGDIRMAAFNLANAAADQAMGEVVEQALVPLMQFHLGQHMKAGGFAGQVERACDQIYAGPSGNSAPLLQAGMEAMGYLPEAQPPVLAASEI